MADEHRMEFQLSDEGYMLLHKIWKARQDAGEKKLTLAQMIREALAARYGQDQQFYSPGEWGVRKDSGKGRGE